MADLLCPVEIHALQTRLISLKEYLRSLDDNQLLRHDQWNEQTAARLLDEDKSYFGALAKQVLG